MTESPPRRPKGIAVGVVVLTVVVAVFAAVQAIFGHSSNFSGTLSPGPAACPPGAPKPMETPPPRPGEPLLPPSPTVALLCLYQSEPNQLVRTLTLNDAAPLVEFLNELPEQDNIACPMTDDNATATLGFLIVVGYPDGHAVIRPAGCGVLESMGGIRYETGLDLFAFWGVHPKDAWPSDAPR